jgi:hypothetical protein
MFDLFLDLRTFGKTIYIRLTLLVDGTSSPLVQETAMAHNLFV